MTDSVVLPKRFVLVGTYAGTQLTDWPNYYNYPIYEDDKIDLESAEKVNEIWLFNGARQGRYFSARFVGRKTREELKSDFGYPAKGKGHSREYLLFAIDKTELHNPNGGLAAKVIVRARDFARTPIVRKQLKEYIETSDRKNLLVANRLPNILTKLPKEDLRVCEAAVQLDFMPMMFPKCSDVCMAPDLECNDQLTVVDLFAGCGGLSLGFELAGFKPVLAVEKDAWASETYSHNRKNVKVVTGDITKIQDPQKAYPDIGKVFGVIGGPPCQGFSLSGDRDPKDPRNSLFMDYMRFVESFRPSFFVMENVLGILSAKTKKGEMVKDVILSVAGKIGYNVQLLQLDASHYGVPQARQRVFFVGIRKDYPFDPARLIPRPTTKEKPITLWDAISDLPRILAGEGKSEMAYPITPVNSYQEWCRKNSNVVMNHVAMRHTQRLVARFHIIKYGESAADVPKEHMQRKRGNASVISGKKYSQNNMRPYPDRPSPTVPASFQSNFVHPYLDRNFTAREGARLQSFPDSYVFCGKRTTMSWEKNLSQYQQIGNAVPPLLAKAIASMIKKYFEQMEETKEHSKESR